MGRGPPSVLHPGRWDGVQTARGWGPGLTCSLHDLGRAPDHSEPPLQAAGSRAGPQDGGQSVCWKHGDQGSGPPEPLVCSRAKEAAVRGV